MRNYTLLILTVLLIISCSKSGGESSGDSNVVIKPNEAVTVSQAEVQEIAEINKAMNNSSQYSLSSDEIQTLFDEGAITASEKNELLALIKE